MEAVKEAEGDIIRSSSAEEYLHLDENRILWVDLDDYYDDDDFCQDDNIKVETLQEWARISRGVFLPQNIAETWESEQGPILVNFTLNGVRCSIHVDYGISADPSMLTNEINPLILQTGYQFEIRDLSPTVWVLVLTPDEKQRLEKEQFWKFY